MARLNKTSGAEIPLVSVSGERVWLHAAYHAHLFHYRMPETVAIAAVSPLIPSPLTVKMAMVAALARDGDIAGAQELTGYLPHLTALHLIPPPGAVSFKAFMRFVRPPADPTSRDGNTGGAYAVSPHIREYTLWQGTLDILLHCPVEAQELLERALWNVAYLGAKDSQVTCQNVEMLENEPIEMIARYAARKVEGVAELEVSGPIFRLADFVADRAPTLAQIIPFSRRKEDYVNSFYLLPGELRGSGRAKLYRRADRVRTKEEA